MLKSPTQSRVAHGVVTDLVNGALDIGMQITEQALARKLGVSRTPVRAALWYLQSEGILEHRAGQGFFIVHRPASVEEAGIEDTAGDELYDRILRDILLGRLDSPMSQSALLRRYDARRGELNTALRRMVREGLAEPAFGGSSPRARGTRLA